MKCEVLSENITFYSCTTSANRENWLSIYLWYIPSITFPHTCTVRNIHISIYSYHQHSTYTWYHSLFQEVKYHSTNRLCLFIKFQRECVSHVHEYSEQSPHANLCIIENKKWKLLKTQPVRPFFIAVLFLAPLKKDTQSFTILWWLRTKKQKESAEEKWIYFFRSNLTKDFLISSFVRPVARFFAFFSLIFLRCWFYGHHLLYPNVVYYNVYLLPFFHVAHSDLAKM